MNLTKPKVLQKGDKVATISLSWGGAGEIPFRYLQGKKQIEDIFGLQVVETTNALKSAEWIYEHPEARANDLMEAFADPSIKAIISNIGGDDSIRTLRYIDIDIIRKNPKIFIGFSDSTIAHFLLLKAGITSFYGTSTLVGFAENGGMLPYQIEDIFATLFEVNPRGIINPSTSWSSQRLEWFDQSLLYTKRELTPSSGWKFIQGNSIVQGRLIGGCMEVLEFLKGTDYWPSIDMFQNSILFFETSEDMPPPEYIRWWLRNYAEMGVLKQINGMIFGRPYHNKYADEYDSEILKVFAEENLIDIPIITQMDFGHTCPIFTLPYGALAEIDCHQRKFSILESGVSN